MQHKNSVLAALITLGTIWGSAFVLMKVLVAEISPTQIVAARLALGAITLLLVLRVSGRFRLPAPGLILPVAALCLIDNVIPNTLVAWSGTHIDSGTAAVLMSTMPLFTTVFAITVLREDAGVVRVAGLALGFVGVVIVSDGGVLDVRSNGGIGMLAVTGAACAHAIGAIYTKTLLKRDDPLRLTALKLTAGAFMTIPGVAFTQGGGAYLHMTAEALLCLVLLGLVATGFAYTLYIWVVGAAGAVYASLVTYIIPVAGLALSWIVLGESIGPATIIGAAVIVTGVALAMYGPSIRIQATLSRPPAPEPSATEPLAS